MRPDAVLREAARGIVSGTSRAVVALMFITLLSCALTAADLQATKSIIDKAEQYRDSGAATLILTAAPASVVGASCDGLGRVDGVTAAGAVERRDEPLWATALPNAPLTVYDATHGFVALLVGAAPEMDGLAISRDLADTLQVKVGDVLATSAGHSLIGAVFDYPSDGRRPGFGWSVVEVTDREAFSECWATSWPEQPEVRSLLLTALTPAGSADTSNPPSVGQLNASKGQNFDGAAQWSGRITRFVPAANFLLTAGVAALLMWLRRLEIASNLHAGVRRRTVLAILLLEVTAWAIPAALLTLVAATLLTLGESADSRQALIWIGVRSAATLLLGAVIGIVVAGSSVRERHLFAFFKNRT